MGFNNIFDSSGVDYADVAEKRDIVFINRMKLIKDLYSIPIIHYSLYTADYVNSLSRFLYDIIPWDEVEDLDTYDGIEGEVCPKMIDRMKNSDFDWNLKEFSVDKVWTNSSYNTIANANSISVVLKESLDEFPLLEELAGFLIGIEWIQAYQTFLLNFYMGSINPCKPYYEKDTVKILYKIKHKR